MNTAAGLGLFLLGAFALIIVELRVPSLEFYAGGTFVALFMFGAFYAWANTIRQTRKLEQKEKQEQKQTAQV